MPNLQFGYLSLGNAGWKLTVLSQSESISPNCTVSAHPGTGICCFLVFSVYQLSKGSTAMVILEIACLGSNWLFLNVI